MRRSRGEQEEDPFAGLGGSSLTPTPASEDAEDAEDEDDFPDRSPSRANVVAMLTVADDETDLEEAGYYVQRAIAESLLLLVDLLAGERRQAHER